MISLRSIGSRVMALAVSFWRSTHATSAVEFAIVALPFFMLVLCILQLGVFYFAQSALDTGVLKTAHIICRLQDRHDGNAPQREQSEKHRRQQFRRYDQQ